MSIWFYTYKYVFAAPDGQRVDSISKLLFFQRWSYFRTGGWLIYKGDCFCHLQIVSFIFAQLYKHVCVYFNRRTMYYVDTLCLHEKRCVKGRGSEILERIAKETHWFDTTELYLNLIQVHCLYRVYLQELKSWKGIKWRKEKNTRYNWGIS